MDWATVASTAVTGVVGIAGVAGAILAARIAGKSATEAARLSITGESDRARLAEKRRIYARAIAALDAGILAGRRAESAATAASDARAAAAGAADASTRAAARTSAAADAAAAQAATADAAAAEAIHKATKATIAEAEAIAEAATTAGGAAIEAAARLSETSAAWGAAFDAATFAVGELQLIAPFPVAGLAYQAWQGLADRHIDAAARNTLINALRADLDEEAQQSKDRPLPDKQNRALATNQTRADGGTRDS